MPRVKKEADVNEHIFPASQLTPLAVKWKELSAAGRHKEAMLVLEQVVEGSTAMFERLAQFEDFHYTVDLSILVSAAQEKVIKWLIKWNPKKGRLFSWFSKSLTGDSRVLLADGTLKRLDEIVQGRLPVKVVSWDERRRAFTAQPVIGWSVCPTQRDGWRHISVEHPSGFRRVLYATFDHEFQTQRGWVAVDNLKSDDKLYLRTNQLTAQGVSAVVGMYLGDAHVTVKHALALGHSRKQRFYVEHLAEHFGKNVYDNEITVKGKVYPTSACCVPLRAIWSDFRKLPRRKVVNSFICEHLDAIALAYWYMDDGSFDAKRGAIKLATDGFSATDCCKLQIALRALGILTHYHLRKNRSYGYLQVLAESRDKFFSLVAPYVLPGFGYKLAEEFRYDYDSLLNLVEPVRLECAFKVRGIVGHTNIRNGRKTGGSKKWFTPDFDLKYDITVAHTENFIAEGIVVHNCAKNAFRSELVKVNQYRKRFHVTSEHLEKFYGVEDHEVDKHDLAKEVRDKIEGMTCRWGDPQEIGAIRFLIECVIDDDDHDKHAAIRSAAYAYGISHELSKFFYSWALSALRHAMYDRIHMPFTEQDLFVAAESYDHIVDLREILTWDQIKQLIAIWGGKRLKIPTINHLAKLKENYALYNAVDKSDQDPDAVAEVAKKFKKTPRSAQQIFEEMVDTLDPRRYGEYSIYDDNNDI